MRIEIGQPGPLKRLLEDRANRMRVGPMRALQAVRHESKVRPRLDARLGKDGGLRAKAFFGSQERDPVDHDSLNGVADGEEPSGEGLGALGEHLPSVLFKQFMFYVDMLKLEGNDGAVARAREDCEGDKRPVAALDFSLRRHCVENGSNLRER